MDAPGWAQIARYNRSPSAAISSGGRRRLVVVRGAVVLRDGACLGLTENARSTATAARCRTVATCSRINRSICFSRSSMLVFVMPLESHGAIAASTPGLNGYS